MPTDFAELKKTLLAIRDRDFPHLPRTLLQDVLDVHEAHLDDPGESYRRVRQLIDETVEARAKC